MNVVCAVIDDGEGRYLACLRPDGKHLGGYWEFPGGKVDPGESPQTALIRELAEELAVRVEVGRPMAPVLWNYGDKRIRLLAFHCRIVSGEAQALEHEEIRWCRPEKFGELRWAEADIPILGEILRISGYESQN